MTRMGKRPYLLGSFFLFFLLGVGLFFLLQLPLFSPLRGGLESLVLPIERMLYGMKVGKADELEKLTQENATLQALVAKNKQTEKEMAALKDQFAFSQEKSRTLLLAHVIGMQDTDTFVLDKGTDDNVKKGDIVVIKDVLLGVIDKVTPHTAILLTMSNPKLTVSVKTSGTNALGIAQGVGKGSMTLDHVVLSDHLDEKDIVLTKGDADKHIPADLSIGKITSVDKKISDVFQQANVAQLLDVSRLAVVFISS